VIPAPLPEPQPARTPAGGGTASVEDAVAAIARGEMVVVVDSEDRENEGDLVMAAAQITPNAVNFMAKHGRGLICVPMLSERLRDLQIPPMVATNEDAHGTAFHVSVDHRAVSTGISAADRALTISALADDATQARGLVQPGHVFPLACRDGGVLRRPGHTEASVDLALMAGCAPVAVICEIAAEDGTMARLPELMEFAAHHRLAVLAISELIEFRRRTEQLVERVGDARLPLDAGDFRAFGFRDRVDGREHIALVYGDPLAVDAPLVRLHSECLTGDAFGSRRCDCGSQLRLALDRIAAEGAGVLVYLRGHEGRGIGLLEKLRSYELQDAGLDTVEANLELGHPADLRDCGAGIQILADLGVTRLRLLTNNPAKRASFEKSGIDVIQCVRLVTDPTPENVTYMHAKSTKMGHELSLYDFFDVSELTAVG
jgi:3,4-dihydroxy 2-butanone 4-phosphate synthase / GTP cyclohydrolase II